MNADMNKETVGGTIICRSIGKQRLYGGWHISLYDGCKNGCKYCDTHEFPMDHFPGYEPVLKADLVSLVSNASFFGPAVRCVLHKDIVAIGMDKLKAQGCTFLYSKRDPLGHITRYETFLTWKFLECLYRIPVVIFTKNVEWMDDFCWRNSRLSHRPTPLSTLVYVFTPGDGHDPSVPSVDDRIRAMQRFRYAYHAPAYLSIKGISDLEYVIYVCNMVEGDDTKIFIDICDEDIKFIAGGIRLLCLGEYLIKYISKSVTEVIVRYYTVSFIENQITNVAPKDFSLILKSKDYYDELMKVWEKEKTTISECI